jgi:Flp pilus assembly protein TadD
LPARIAAYRAYQEHGTKYLADHFEDLTVNFHPSDPKDIILNSLGYDLLFDDHIPDAVAIFQLNTTLFPGVANTWDSYGEALLANGEKDAARKAYQKALALDPELPSAKAALKALEP